MLNKTKELLLDMGNYGFMLKNELNDLFIWGFSIGIKKDSEGWNGWKVCLYVIILNREISLQFINFGDH